MTAADYADSPGWSLSPRAKLEILFATLLALFLFALDQTVVGVASRLATGNSCFYCERGRVILTTSSRLFEAGDTR